MNDDDTRSLSLFETKHERLSQSNKANSSMKKVQQNSSSAIKNKNPPKRYRFFPKIQKKKKT